MAPKSNFVHSFRAKLCLNNLIAIVITFEFCSAFSPTSADCFNPTCVHFQVHNESNKVKINFEGVSKDRVTTFCYDGLQQSLIYIFANPVLRMTQSENPPNDSAKIVTFYGTSKPDVDFRRQQPGYSIVQSWVATLRTPRQTEDFSMNPFNVSCIAIETDVKYSASIKVKAIDLWYVSYLVAGVILFFSARTWSHNITLHYGAGVSIGVLAGFVLILFVLTRFLPSKLKSLGYLLVAFGGSATLWMMSLVNHFFSDPVVDTIVNYWQYILAYCVVTGIISFAVVYRMGGVTDERSLNLIQWLLQVIGLILIYNSTQIRDVSIVLVIITVTAYNFPRALLSNSLGKKYWNKFFPRKIKLLSEDEYINQGNQETKKALEQLRDYCRSPECQSWKIISKLKSPQRIVANSLIYGTPLANRVDPDETAPIGAVSSGSTLFANTSNHVTMRFAEFVEGSSWHITNEELLEYDSEGDLLPPHESMDQGGNGDNDDNESEMDFILSSP